MGLWQYNIRPVHAHSNVNTVKTARKVKGKYIGQREPNSDEIDLAGREPLDYRVFTAGFTFQSRPGYLLSPSCMAGCP